MVFTEESSAERTARRVKNWINHVSIQIAETVT
jgi:hypothetical protein